MGVFSVDFFRVFLRFKLTVLVKYMQSTKFGLNISGGWGGLSLHAGEMPSLMYFAFNLCCDAVGWLTARFSCLQY